MMIRKTLFSGILLAILFNGALYAMGRIPMEKSISIKNWKTSNDHDCSINLKPFNKYDEKMLSVQYELKEGTGWVEFKTDQVRLVHDDQPISFTLKANASSTLEIKFVDKDGSVYGKRINMKNKYKDWQEITISTKNMEYWWGGDEHFNELESLAIGISGSGDQGRLLLKNIKTDKRNKPLTFKSAGSYLDENREMAGIGFEQRRMKTLIPEDPGVIEFLKLIQDTSSNEKQLIPSQEGLSAQTFNNALVAMAFLLKGEVKRAERILSFYANAMKKDNMDPTLQNFYFKGEARGFFQNVRIKSDGGIKAYHQTGESDRWMGDMAWLYIAFNYYEKKTGNPQYAAAATAIVDLLKSWYKDDLSGGGYVQHGWRKGDRYLHESGGHPEGNIDCYAVFKLSGDLQLAGKVKLWVEKKTGTRPNLPLDLYTWRSLAYAARPDLLDIPEFDLRYRKIMTHGDEINVMGFFHTANSDVDNIWLDGVGHMACAYYAVGNQQRGNFYANQLDAFLIERRIAGQTVKALPYTANKSGGYEWVDLDRGFASTCAWYIFAKNKFNPLNLKQY